MNNKEIMDLEIYLIIGRMIIITIYYLNIVLKI